MSPLGLSIDLGTSHTVAVLRGRDGVVVPLLFDGSPLLVSAVFAKADGSLAVGRDALRSARLAPERFEANPKRRIDDGVVMLGDAEVSVEDIFTAILRRVRDECVRVVGAVPAATLTHPATWGPVRRQILLDAADVAGMPAPQLMPEPVAAANYFAGRQTTDIPVGSVIVVYDLGGGTFDVSAVRRGDSGFEVLAADGAGDLGGVDIDDAVMTHLGRPHADDLQWARLLAPETPDQRRQRRLFLDDVRSAKEQLSRDSHVDLLIPLVEREVHLTRGELEDLARPLLDRTVRLTQALIRVTGTNPTDIAGLFLVGGASRMPLAATLLHRATGITPTTIEQPETVVAQGALPSDQVRAAPPSPPAPVIEPPAAPLIPHAEPTQTSTAADDRTPPLGIKLAPHLGQQGDEEQTKEQEYRTSADAGDSGAMHSLGWLLQERGDVVGAEFWYRKAVDAGSTMAMCDLGFVLEKQDNRAGAEEWYRRGADAGDAAAMCNLGFVLEKQGDLVGAEDWYRRAIVAGNTAAMCNLGLMLEKQGDLVGAKGWYRKGADAGDTTAMNNLGGLLRDRGDLDGAEDWYRKAADTGNATAMHNLGIVLLKNRGDLAGAESWYRKAIEAGSTAAMASLGYILKNHGDLAGAEEWYRNGADAGDTTAMDALGLVLQNRGDLLGAKEWRRKAKEAGLPSAMTRFVSLFRKQPN